ncbi:MAG: FixH family protein [Rhodocyclaceae bacterium]
MIQKTNPAKRWYREPWPWILMAGPATVVVAGVITAYLAVISNDGLVEDDYYKQGLAVNQSMARDQKAGALGMQAEVVRGGDGTLLRIFLRASEGVALPASLHLKLTHPTRSGIDQKLVLLPDGAGFYAGKLDAPLSGRWHVALEDGPREWRLLGDWRIEKQSTLKLGAALPANGISDLRSDKKGG